MPILTVDFSAEGFVYDVDNPTEQTERLSYMIAEALDTRNFKAYVEEDIDIQNRADVISNFWDMMKNGFYDEETGQRVEALTAALAKISEAISYIQSLSGVAWELGTIRGILKLAYEGLDEGGNQVGGANSEAISALQDIAAACGLRLDAYKDVFEVSRIVSP